MSASTPVHCSVEHPFPPHDAGMQIVGLESAEGKRCIQIRFIQKNGRPSYVNIFRNAHGPLLRAIALVQSSHTARESVETGTTKPTRSGFALRFRAIIDGRRRCVAIDRSIATLRTYRDIEISNLNPLEAALRWALDTDYAGFPATTPAPPAETGYT